MRSTRSSEDMGRRKEINLRSERYERGWKMWQDGRDLNGTDLAHEADPARCVQDIDDPQHDKGARGRRKEWQVGRIMVSASMDERR